MSQLADVEQWECEMIDQLDLLLSQYEDLQNQSQHDDLSDLPQESAIIANRFQAAIDRMVQPGDTYGRESEAARREPVHVKLRMLARLAYALREDLKAGWSTTLASLVHAETSADMVEMAQNLNASKYKDAAVVIIGTALELHLRQMCPAAGVASTDPKGKPKKADLLKAELRKQGSFGPVQEKQIAAWLGLRNAAAHGAYSQYTEQDAAVMIVGVSAFIDSHPA